MGKYKIKGWKKLLCLGLCSCQLLTGCALLPVEEARPTLVVQTMEEIDYNLESVKREDLVNSKFIYCTYVQLQDESLSFDLDNKAIEKVYVEVGTSVKKGDLLAELNLGTLEEDIQDLNYSIQLSKENLYFTKTIMNLEISKEEKLFHKGLLSKEDYETNVKKVKESYEDTIYRYEDNLYIDELKLDSYMGTQEKGRIYAGMDGIVSYVKENLEGQNSVAREDVIRIIDNSLCAFRVETEYASYFKDGETVEIEMRLDGGTIHEGVISHDEENPNIVYFELLEPNFTLSVGDRGTIHLILEEKEDVLTISKRALRKAENFHYVYYINEDGIRSMQEVTIGMEGNNSIEITSGLEFGDIVITR